VGWIRLPLVGFYVVGFLKRPFTLTPGGQCVVAAAARARRRGGWAMTADEPTDDRGSGQLALRGCSVKICATWHHMTPKPKAPGAPSHTRRASFYLARPHIQIVQLDLDAGRRELYFFTRLFAGLLSEQQNEPAKT
jgi:hypothetical protein